MQKDGSKLEPSHVKNVETKKNHYKPIKQRILESFNWKIKYNYN